MDDFRSWCHQRSEFYSNPKLEHEPFVPKYYINSYDDLFVFITIRKLISTAPLSNLLQVDATFKLNWNEFPVIVFGSSDGNRRFHPYGIAVISTNEAASSYITLIQTIKERVFTVTGKQIERLVLVNTIILYFILGIRYDIQYLLDDGAKGITVANVLGTTYTKNT